MIEINTWQLICWLIGIGITICGTFFKIGQMFLKQFDAKLNARFEAADQLSNAAMQRIESLALKAEVIATEAEKSSRELQLEVAQKYQKREDAIRAETVALARYDAINANINRLLENQAVQRIIERTKNAI